jgi:hypothetical protein
MSEAMFQPDLAVAELHGSVRAPEFEWIMIDAKTAIASLAEKNEEGRVPASQVRNIIKVCQRINASIAPGTNVIDARNALRREIGLGDLSVIADASDVLPPDWKPKIPQAFRTLDE